MDNREITPKSPAIALETPSAPAEAQRPLVSRIDADLLLSASRRGGEPSWLTERRAQSLERFNRLGLPSLFQEEWRGTNLRSRGIANLPVALPSATGSSGRSPVVLLEADSLIGTSGRNWPVYTHLEQALSENPALVERFLNRSYEPDNIPSLVAQNAALTGPGAFFHVPAASAVEQVLGATIRPDPQMPTLFPHNVVALEEGSRAAFFEDFTSDRRSAGSTFANGVTEVFVGPHAHLDILTIIRWDDALTANHHCVAHVAEGGTLKWHIGTLGGGMVRCDIDVFMDGPHAESHIIGVGLGHGTQHLDHRTVQNHVAIDTRSRINFGTLLWGRSHSIYRGLINMELGALRSDAYQKNDNLIMQNGAKAQAIPMLEISTDDVKCSHGSTVGRLRDEDIFYLTSRGIPRLEAQSLIADGFIRRVLSSAGDSSPLAEKLHRILAAKAFDMAGISGDATCNDA